MHILLDKLGATMIAMTIFMMVFSVNSRNSRTMNETSIFYATATQTENFAKILRRDMQGIESVLTVDETNQGGGVTQFSFVTRIGQDTTKRTIIYRKTPTSVFHGTQFYTIERLVDGTADGGSSDIVTDWVIRALNEDAGNITDPDDAAQVFVHFETASPALETDVVQSLSWESRFFPPLRN